MDQYKVNILYADGIDFKSLIFSESINRSELKLMYIGYNKDSLFIETPYLKVISYDDTSLMVELTEEFCNSLEELDGVVMEKIDCTWRDISMYKLTTRHESISDKPVMKLRIHDSRYFQTTIFDSNKEKCTRDILTEGIFIKAVLEIESVWSNKKGVSGIHIKTHQIKVRPQKQSDDKSIFDFPQDKEMDMIKNGSILETMYSNDS